jgi:hypothetical protein
MKKFLINLLQKALAMLGHAEPVDPKYDLVKGLVAWADTLNPPNDFVTGERKRAQVLSKLIHEFPDEKPRNLAFLIEKVIQDNHKQE